jgi:hypothetical protein
MISNKNKFSLLIYNRFIIREVKTNTSILLNNITIIKQDITKILAKII